MTNLYTNYLSNILILTADILLKETDTVWMFVLPGTAKEIEGDEDVRRTLQKRAKQTEKTGVILNYFPSNLYIFFKLPKWKLIFVKHQFLCHYNT